jgi:DNA-binding PadR family transcriptional regulator
MTYNIYTRKGETIKTDTVDGKAAFEQAKEIEDALFFSIQPYYWVDGKWGLPKTEKVKKNKRGN